MAKRKLVNLTEVSLITCVVQKGMADVINQSLLDAGVQGATVHQGVGTGIRERMGFLGVAVDVEREIISVLVAKDQLARIFERMFLAGRLDTPGMGYIYATPLVQAATYIPAHLLEDRPTSAMGAMA
ncbi:MAG: P-II family nitrogen regulator [Burkholderiaceae bacterium]